MRNPRLMLALCLTVGVAALLGTLAPRTLAERAAASPSGAPVVTTADPGVTVADPGAFLDADLHALARKAQDAYTAGKFQEAADAYLDLLRRNITDSNSIYNLACCYGLLGRDDLAARFLIRAYRAGYRDVHHIRRDPDFDRVRGVGRFRAVVDSLAGLAAEEDSTRAQSFWVRAPSRLLTRVRLPDGFDPAKPHTLVVGLHGLGGDPDRFLTLENRIARPDFIFATPQAPYPTQGRAEPGFSWYLHDDSLLFTQTRDTAVEYIVSVVQMLKAHFRTDKVYLLGFSQGAHMTYNVGLRHPELFDGLLAFGGWLDRGDLGAKEIAKAAKVPVFIGQGTADSVVSPANAVRVRDLLKGNGYRVELREFTGGHTVDAPTLEAGMEWIRK